MDADAAMGPAGLITASVEDVLAFARMHLEGGVATDGTRVLSTAGCDAMAAKEAELPDAHTLGDSWGLGWIRFGWDGERLIGHDGNTIGSPLPAAPPVPPARGRAAHERRQHDGPLPGSLPRDLPLGRRCRDAAPLEPPVVSPDVDPERYVGRYERAAMTTEVFVDDRGLTLRATATGPLAELMPEPVHELPLVAVEPELFVVRLPGETTWTPVTFYELENALALRPLRRPGQSAGRTRLGLLQELVHRRGDDELEPRPAGADGLAVARRPETLRGRRGRARARSPPGRTGRCVERRARAPRRPRRGSGAGDTSSARLGIHPERDELHLERVEAAKAAHDAEQAVVVVCDEEDLVGASAASAVRARQTSSGSRTASSYRVEKYAASSRSMRRRASRQRSHSSARMGRISIGRGYPSPPRGRVQVRQSPVSPSQQPTLKRQRGHWNVPCRHSIAAPQRRQGSVCCAGSGGRGGAIVRDATASLGRDPPPPRTGGRPTPWSAHPVRRRRRSVAWLSCRGSPTRGD
jgi:hypothetical protein